MKTSIWILLIIVSFILGGFFMSYILDENYNDFKESCDNLLGENNWTLSAEDGNRIWKCNKIQHKLNKINSPEDISDGENGSLSLRSKGNKKFMLDFKIETFKYKWRLNKLW